MKTHYLPAANQDVEIFSMSEELTRFRRQLETEAGEPIQDLEVNAALLLSDLCHFLKLGQKQQDMILGAQASHYLFSTVNTPIRPVPDTDD